MIKNRSGRKRAVSIYSILTIIVLISISGGCADIPESELLCTKTALVAIRGCTDRSAVLPWTTSNDASLLVTTRDFEFAKGDPGQGRFEAEIKRRRFTQNDSIVMIKIDGYYIPDALWEKIELSPGLHKITYIIKHTYITYIKEAYSNVEKSIQELQTKSINVEKNRVYFLVAGFSTTKLSQAVVDDISVMRFSAIAYGEIYRTPHTYDKTTGIATHPTNSKLSFKIK